MRSARATAAGFLGVGVIACYLLAALQTALRRARDAEQQQRRVNEELLRSNRDLQAFAFAASHDLREPLRTVSTYSQLLVQSARDGKLDETNVAAGFIVESTRRMDNLLDDLLAYTQLNTDPQDHAEEPVDLNRVFSATLQNLQTMIVESRAAITCANLPAVNGRESHFIQVFQNLVENAIKYSGDRTPEVHITAQRQGAEWRLAVRDNGMGIDPAYHQHIFEVFKRLHGHKIPGTGVGLAICRRVVERCGGRIWVESQPGSGSVFYFTLPASRQA